jgi:hypothetical protein
VWRKCWLNSAWATRLEEAWALDSGFSPPYNGAFQIGKLRSELEMVSGNVRVMSEMLTELVPTQVEPADLELLQVSKQPASRFSPHQSDPVCSHTCFLPVYIAVLCFCWELSGNRKHYNQEPGICIRQEFTS